MELLKQENGMLKATWKIPIQVMKYTKNNTEYFSFKASLPVDLKRYIETYIVNPLERVDFCFLKGNIMSICPGDLDDVTRFSGSPKLISGKQNQLYITLPKKLPIFCMLVPDKKYILVYELVYIDYYQDYLILVDVEEVV